MNTTDNTELSAQALENAAAAQDRANKAYKVAYKAAKKAALARHLLPDEVLQLARDAGQSAYIRAANA